MIQFFHVWPSEMERFIEFLFQEEKLSFFLVLERDLGVDHEEVIRATGSLVNAQVS